VKNQEINLDNKLPVALPWARLLSNQSKGNKTNRRNSEKNEEKWIHIKGKGKKIKNLDMLMLDLHGGD
jgi:hypothetical protein